MVARAVVGIPTVLCLWISEIIASLPGRCLHGPGTADRHHADRLWLDQPGDSGGSMPAALDQLLLDGAQGAVRLEGDGPCLVPHCEAGVPIRAPRGDDTLIPRVSEAAPGAAIQYDHARKPNRPDYLLTVVSLSAVNSWGSWSVPLMSNLARQPRQARNDAGPGGGERNPGRDHLAARCLVHEEVPDRRCPYARRHRHRPGDTALYEPPPPGKPGRPRKYGDRITSEKLRTFTQTHTELPIYGRTVRYRTAVCRARFLGGRLVRV